MWLSARWGGSFTPRLVVLVLALMSWRWAFVLFGGLGVIWAILFYGWFRDRPAEHPGVNPAERALMEDAERNAAGHGQVPWAQLLRSPTVWLLWLQYFCFSYGWYFYITWLPTYLKQGRGLDAGHAAALAGFPLFFGGVGAILSGTLFARLVAWSGDIRQTRRRMCYGGFVSSALLLVWSAHIRDPLWAMIVMGLSSFTLDLTLPCSWATCLDVGGRYAGTLSGSMNMMGNIAGGVAPVIIGHLLKQDPGNWQITFWISGAVYLVGAVAWMRIDPVTPLEGTSGPTGEAGGGPDRLTTGTITRAG
jgi:predicted MFS family arabinose efflux permease